MWRHTLVAVLCVVLGSDGDNMFAEIENPGRLCQAAQWVLRRN